MSWQVKFDDENRLIFISFFSDVSKNDIQESIIEAISLISDKNVRKILTDFTEALSLDLSTMDIYKLHADYRKTTGLNVPFIETIVCPKESKIINDIHFYETECINKGIRAKIFEDRNQALEWLIR